MLCKIPTNQGGGNTSSGTDADSSKVNADDKEYDSRSGMATFTIAKGGLMYEATLGGQKFKYEPLSKRTVVIDEPPSGGFFFAV